MTINRSGCVPAVFGLLATLLLVSDVSAQYALQYGAAVETSGSTAFIGEGRNLLLPGSVFVYDIDAEGRWTERQTLAAWDAGEEADGFGRAIAAAGDIAVVGAPQIGRAFVYRRGTNGMWERGQVLHSDHPNFGSAVATDGRTVAVAASGGRAGESSVSVFAERDRVWTAVTTLTSSDTTRGTAFGASLDVAGDVIVVGAPGSNRRAGAVEVFHPMDGRAGNWESVGALQLPGPEDNDRFGTSVMVAAGAVYVGAPGRDRQTGAVAAFVRDGDTGDWTFDRRFTAPSSRGGEMFGSSLAASGSTVLVGAPGVGDREGAVYAFTASAGSEWLADVVTIAPPTRQYRSSFGNAMAGGSGLFVVGAVGHDNFEGAAFPFIMRNGDANVGDVMINDSGRFASVTGGAVECSEGSADSFGCSEVDMISFLSREDIGARRGIQVNDVWGWTDPATDGEYAIVGRTDGTSFIDLSDPYNPVYLGDLPKTEGANQSIWRDVKVYKNHAFIVSDGAGPHHMQIFDLTQLRNLTDVPRTFKPTALYKGIYSSHNIVINEDTGFAYAVGSDSGGETCGGALHMINIQDPVNPTFAGCFADLRTGRGTGATHDAQCVLYQGPDNDYKGREICLSSNGTALSIADVTDKSSPRAISIAEYPNVAYTHQGWLTDDHRYFYLNDEGDEASNLVEGTRTLILDLTDLDDPVIAGEYVANHNSIDHNLYVKGNTMYQTNYSAGLRLLDISDPENPVEVGHFDTVPYGKNDNSPVLGAWSNYPYFKSGVIVVTSGREGVFFLKKRSVDI